MNRAIQAIRHTARRSLRRVRKFFTYSDPNWDRVLSGFPKGKADLSQPYTQHPIIYSCIKCNAKHVAGVDLKLYRGQADDKQEITEGRLYRVLNRPNEHWSIYTLKEAITTWLELEGNVMLLADRERPNAEPNEIWALPRHHFEPVFDGSGTLVRWIFTRPGTDDKLPLEPWQAIHIFYYNPYHVFWGVGPLEAARRLAEMDLHADNFNRAFFDRGGRPSYIITATDMDHVQWERLKAQIENDNSGPDSFFKPFYAEGENIKVDTPTVSHNDMAFVQQKELTSRQLAGIFGVPPTKLANFLEVHKATARSVDKAYYEDTIFPIFRVIEDALRGQFFFPYDSEQTWAEFDRGSIEALQDDYTERLDRGTKLFAMGYPPNMINEKLNLGMESVPWGDIGYLPIGLVPAGSDPFAAPDDEEPEQPEEEPPEDDEPDDEADDPGQDDEPASDDDEDEDEEDADRTLAPIPGKKSRRGRVRSRVVSVGSLRHERLAWLWRAAVDPVEARFNRGLLTYLRAVKKELATLLGDAAGNTELVAELLQRHSVEHLMIGAEFDQSLRELARKHYIAVGKTMTPVIDEHLNEAGFDYRFDVADPRMVAVIARKEIKIVQRVNQKGIREQVRGVLMDSVAVNGTIAEAQTAIAEKVGLVQTRSLTIARTEIGGAANQFEAKAEEIAGVRKHMWVAALDEVTRPSHVGNMSLGPWPIDEAFPNGCYYPHDPDGAAGEVINCRCSLMAVE